MSVSKTKASGVEIPVYVSLAERPAAAVFGVGQCQIGSTIYLSDGVSWSTLAGSSTANLLTTNTGAANATLVQTLLDAAPTTHISEVIVNANGVVPMDSINIPSRVSLIFNASVFSANGRNSPVLRNKYNGYLAPSQTFTRASNVATISVNNCGYSVGDILTISGGSDATFRGIVTLTAVSSTSFSYASTGVDTTVVSGTYYNVIKLRRSIAGSSFVATSGYITVTDPGHDLRTGFRLYLVNSGGSTFAPGIVTVTKTTQNTWTYFVSGTTGTGTGTTYLSYDFDITITGNGMIDGNRIGQGAQPGGAALLSAGMFCMTNALNIQIPFGGTSIRGLNLYSCTDVKLDGRWYAFDCLVGVQFEGGTQGVTVDSYLTGDAAFHSTSAQQPDDYVAFSSVINASGAGGNYDDMVSPYGLTPSSNIDVRAVNIGNALNGVKITAHSSSPFTGVFHVGTIRGHLGDNSPSLNPVGGISIIDDGPGLVGTTVAVLKVDGAFEWSTPTNTATATHVILNGVGSIKRLDLTGIINSTTETSVIAMTGMTVGTISISKSHFIPTNFDMPIKLLGGTIGILHIENCSMLLATLFAYVAGTTIKVINLINNAVGANVVDVGRLFNFDSAVLPAMINVNGLQQLTETSNNIQKLFDFSSLANAFGTLRISLANIQLTTKSGMGADSTSNTGTVIVNVANNVNWLASGTQEFIRSGCYTWTINAVEGFSCPVEKLFFFAFGIPTLRINSPSSGAQINLNNAATYGSAQMAPQNGDEAYNSTAGAIPVGRVIRRAGAWTAI